MDELSFSNILEIQESGNDVDGNYMERTIKDNDQNLKLITSTDANIYGNKSFIDMYINFLDRQFGTINVTNLYIQNMTRYYTEFFEKEQNFLDTLNSLIGIQKKYILKNKIDKLSDTELKDMNLKTFDIFLENVSLSEDFYDKLEMSNNMFLKDTLEKLEKHIIPVENRYLTWIKSIFLSKLGSEINPILFEDLDEQDASIISNNLKKYELDTFKDGGFYKLLDSKIKNIETRTFDIDEEDIIFEPLIELTQDEIAKAREDMTKKSTIDRFYETVLFLEKVFEYKEPNQWSNRDINNFKKYIKDIQSNNIEDYDLDEQEKYLDGLKFIFQRERAILLKIQRLTVTKIYCGEVSYGQFSENFKDEMRSIRNKLTESNSTISDDIRRFIINPEHKNLNVIKLDRYKENFEKMMYFFSNTQIPNVLTNNDYFSQLQVEDDMYHNMSLVIKFVLRKLVNDKNWLAFGTYVKNENLKFIFQRSLKMYANVWRGKVVFNYLNNYFGNTLMKENWTRNLLSSLRYNKIFLVDMLKNHVGAYGIQYLEKLSQEPYFRFMINTVISADASTHIKYKYYLNKNNPKPIISQIYNYTASLFRTHSSEYYGLTVENYIKRLKLNVDTTNYQNIIEPTSETLILFGIKLLENFVFGWKLEIIETYQIEMSKEETSKLTEEQKGYLATYNNLLVQNNKNKYYDFYIQILAKYMGKMIVWRILTDDIYFQYDKLDSYISKGDEGFKNLDKAVNRIIKNMFSNNEISSTRLAHLSNEQIFQPYFQEMYQLFGNEFFVNYPAVDIPK